MNSTEEVILETEEVRVRILVLEEQGATAWHFHTQVTDRMLCLEGLIAVEQQIRRSRSSSHPESVVKWSQEKFTEL